MRIGARVRDRFAVDEALAPLPGRTRWGGMDVTTGEEIELWCLSPAVVPPRQHAAWLHTMAAARAAAGARRALDCGSDGVIAWIAYAGAGSGPRVAAAAPMPLEHVIGWMRAVAPGLAAAHRTGWVHGAFSEEDVAVVGAEVRIGGVGVWSHLPAGVLAAAWGGDAWQLAPEVRAGAAPTAASDAWAMAFIAARLLAGDHRDRASVIAAQPSDDLRALFDRALADDPARRIGTGGLIEALLAIARAPIAALAPVAGAVSEPPSGSGSIPVPDGLSTSSGKLVAVSMRPADEPRKTARLEVPPPDATPAVPKARLRPIEEALPPSFPKHEGGLGYIAPPVARRPPPAPSPRRNVIVALAIALVVVIAIGVIAAVAR